MLIINVQANTLEEIKSKQKYKKAAIVPAFINDGRFADPCAICLEEVANGSVMVNLECGHQFHIVCMFETIQKSDNNKCPMCRKSLTSVIIK
jgi:DNA-directed RNA polymerase subunit RPC12/RpoP